MQEEMKSLQDNDTFSLTSLPEGRTAIGSRWVYTVKDSLNGSNTHKARFVAKGYSQQKGVDYQETFAPTANITSIRCIMQLAAQYGLELHQMDVKTAYLHADIDTDIYMEQAEGFEVYDKYDKKLVYKLNKSIYGLKQSGRNWNNLLHEFLIDNQFTQSQSDNCVYTRYTQDGLVIILIWVDDLIIAANNDKLMSEVKHMLGSKFAMKDLGRLSYFLGMRFEQGEGYVKMDQSHYVNKLLEKHNMSECKPRSTPSEPKIESEGEEVDEKKYREIVGSLIYLMICTRPDICWIVTRLSQFLSRPLQSHWVAAKHVLRYLKGTIDQNLCYRKSDDTLSVIGYSDADWASNSEDRRSTSGYCFSLSARGPLISWKSKKQPTVALSTCEAEYIALTVAAQEGLYLIQWLNHFQGISLPEYCVIHEDNQGAIALANNPVSHQRSKHIDIRYHFIRNLVRNETIQLRYCPTEDMVADIMTKSVSKIKLQNFKSVIFG